jgi:exonuclease SbcD
MRILHTADLHIGKLLHGFSRLPEQREALAHVLNVAKTERPDLVILAGDLYDRAVPPADAVELFSGFLEELVLDLQLPVFAIAGNHDSAERLGFGSRLLLERGLHLVGPPTPPRVVTLDLEDGPADIVLLPYATPEAIRAVMGSGGAGDGDAGDGDAGDGDASDGGADEGADDNAEVMLRGHEAALTWQRDTALAALGRPLHPRSVCVAHAFVHGGAESESERTLTVGGTGAVSRDVFGPFAYTALGHLHRPQSLGPEGRRDAVRYSGSLLPYSFSELPEAPTDATSREAPAYTSPKSLSVVDIDPDGAVSLETAPMLTSTGMRMVEGTLEALLARGRWEREHFATRADDLILARLTDTRPVLDAMARLRQSWPNTLHIERTGIGPRAEGTPGPTRDHRKMSPLDLFEDFVEQMRGKDDKLADDERAVVEAVISDVTSDVIAGVTR